MSVFERLRRLPLAGWLVGWLVGLERRADSWFVQAYPMGFSSTILTLFIGCVLNIEFCESVELRPCLCGKRNEVGC